MTLHTIDLRPLKVGEILDRAFRLYRANFWLFIGAAGIFLVPFLALELLSLFVFQQPIFLFLIELLFIININFLNGALSWIASCAYLRAPISINQAYQRALHHFWSLFAANLRLGLIHVSSFVVALIVVIPLAVLVSSVREAIYRTFFLMILPLPTVLYVIFWSTRWGLVVPVIMIDNLGASDAMTRSWSITAKDFWRIFVVLIGLNLFSYLTILLSANVLQYAVAQFSLTGFVNPMLWSVFIQVGLLLGIPLSGSILVILYYDVRVRHEGYDIQFALGIADEGSDIVDKQSLPDSEQ